MAVPQDAWKPGTGRDGTVEEDKDVAEIMHLMTRAGNWPGGLRWIARRVKPSRRQGLPSTGSLVINRPVDEMAIGTTTLTGVEFVNDRIRYGFTLGGNPVVVEEDPEAAFRGLHVEG